MSEGTTVVGLDVHKDDIAVAVAWAGGGAAESRGTIPNRPEAVRTLVRRLGTAATVRCCDEAGPCGYGVPRQLTGLGVACDVVAPGLVPVKPGERIKTDRRDALKLARLSRSGELTPVWVPDVAHEALRDLTRARGDARADEHRARQRLGKFLLRLDLRPPEGVRPGTARYRQWLDGLRLGEPAQRTVLREYRAAVEEAGARLARLEDEVAEVAQTGPHATLLGALQTLRGAALVTAATLVAELGDLRRFDHPSQLMADVGLVPSEHASGGRQRRGAITKTGNAEVRRVVVEAAWHDRHAPSLRGALRRRQVGQSPPVTRIAWQAQERVPKRWRRLLGRGKLTQQAVVAVAREVVGFIWAIARAVAAEAAGVGAAGEAVALAAEEEAADRWGGARSGRVRQRTECPRCAPCARVATRTRVRRARQLPANHGHAVGCLGIL
jgi:transposase